MTSGTATAELTPAGSATQPVLGMEHCLLTDIGKVRRSNQDSAAIFCSADGEYPPWVLYVVADGMGGRSGGETASRVAVEAVTSAVTGQFKTGAPAATAAAIVTALNMALETANEAVLTAARADRELTGMGTTCVAVLTNGVSAAVGSVGDSRCYLLRDGSLRQLTEDHSLVQEQVATGQMTHDEARRSRFRNVITRGLGLARDVTPDVSVVDLSEGDVLLLCTDGLTGMAPDSTIEADLQLSPDVATACKVLVDEALQGGGTDNITVIVARVAANSQARPTGSVQSVGDTVEKGTRSTPGQFARRAVRSVCVALLLVVIAGLSSFSTYYYLQKHGLITVHVPAPVQVPINLNSTEYANPVILLREHFVRLLPNTLPDGSLLAVRGTGALVRISPAGKVVGSVGVAAARSGTAGPYWAVDAHGYIYTTDAQSGSVYRYSTGGTRVGDVGGGKLKKPQGLCVGLDSSIYVLQSDQILVLRALLRPVTIHAPGPGGPLGAGEPQIP